MSASPTRLHPILKPSKYTFSPSRTQPDQKPKDLASPSLFVKQTSFNLDENVTSLGDLEACRSSGNTIEQPQSSSASTLATSTSTSTMSIEGRSISRNLSLLTDFETNDEEQPRTPKSSTLQSLKTSQEVSKEQEVGNVQHKIQVNHKEASKSINTTYQRLRPSFESEGPLASSFTFSNRYRTVTYTNHTRFSTVFGDVPLPSSGKYKFSVHVDRCTNKNPKLYVGVVTKDQKDKPLSYKHGSYFVNTFSTESYLNGLKLLKPETFATQGQIVSVLVDMDEKHISFQVDGLEILSGKLLMPVGNKMVELYPCISLGELGGTVSFI